MFAKSVKLTWLSMMFLGAGIACSFTSEQDEVSPSATMAEFCNNVPRPIFANFSSPTNKVDWFELYQISDGITAIAEPYQWQETISYLIEGSDSALLFDTGNGIGDLYSVVTQLSDKPITVLNSHSHYDHVGGNYAFKQIASLNTSFSIARQRGIANKDIRIEVSPAALCKPLPKNVTINNHIGRAYTISQFIDDGHIFDLGDRQLEVIHVPGHTPDALVLIDRNAGLLWTGDTFYQGPIWLYAPETDLTAYRESLTLLANLAPELTALLPAHNTPWASPKLLLDAQTAFEQLLAGQLVSTDGENGTVIYHVNEDSSFSFLLRQGALENWIADQ